MGDLLTSVPLRPGMAQRGVPVVSNVATASGDVFFSAGARAVVSDVDPDDGLLSIEGGWFAPRQWSLDLTEPLGRAVGWAWLEDQDAGADLAGAGLTARDALRLLDLAMRWRPMTPAQVDRFARLILAVGGEGA